MTDKLAGLTWAQVWALPVGHCTECDGPINGYMACGCPGPISLAQERTTRPTLKGGLDVATDRIELPIESWSNDYEL